MEGQVSFLQGTQEAVEAHRSQGWIQAQQTPEIGRPGIFRGRREGGRRHDEGGGRFHQVVGRRAGEIQFFLCRERGGIYH